MRSWRLTLVAINLHPWRPSCPLPNSVHYFNKATGSSAVARDESFRFVDGQVRMHFGGRVFGTRFQPIVERAGSQPAGHEAHLHVLGATAAPAQTVFPKPGTMPSWFTWIAWRALHALNFCWSGAARGFLALNVHPQLIRGARPPRSCVRDGAGPLRPDLRPGDAGARRRLEPVAPLAAAIAEYRERGHRVAIDNFGRHTSDLERPGATGPGRGEARPQPDRPRRPPEPRQAGDDRTLRRGPRLGMSVVCQCIENPLQLDVAGRLAWIGCRAIWLAGWRPIACRCAPRRPWRRPDPPDRRNERAARGSPLLRGRRSHLPAAWFMAWSSWRQGTALAGGCRRR